MRVIPVLDILAGQVVHAAGGRRHEYKLLHCNWTASTHPKDVAKALTERFGFKEIYAADLDAIAGRPLNRPALDELCDLGLHLWLDGGIHDAADARQIAALADTVVVGLETVDGPDAMAAILSEIPAQRIVFSLDLRDGQPLANTNAWDGASPQAIASQALALGIQRILVLDLARVGSNAGPGGLDLCRCLVTTPGCEISLGGGVRGPGDLRELPRLGIHAVLVASALYDGRITPSDL